MLGKHVLELGHLAGIGEESGHRGTVPVAAERDGVLAAQVEPVLDMCRQLVEGDVCSGLVGCVVGKELAAVVEADDTAHVANGAELVVGEIALDAADGAGVGVAGDEGARGVGDNLVKALIVEVGDVEYHAGVLHLRKCLDAGGGEAGVGIVPARERSLRVPAE